MPGTKRREGPLSLEEIGTIVAPIADRYGADSVYVHGDYAMNRAKTDSTVGITIPCDVRRMGSLLVELETALCAHVDLIAGADADVIGCRSVYKKG